MRFSADAYSLEAVVNAGVPAKVARALVVDGPRAVPERPRVSTSRRGRGPETTSYIWGPDANALLAEPAQGGAA